MTPYNPDEIARLIAEAREDDELMTRGPWSVPSGTRLLGAVNATIDGMDRQVASAAGQALQFDDTADVGRQLGINAAAIARTRNNLRAMADQLEAAGRAYDAAVDIARAGERAIASTLVDYDNACAERDRLQSDLESVRKDAEHWREARRVAIDGGEILKTELEAARREVERLNHVRATWDRAASGQLDLVNEVAAERDKLLTMRSEVPGCVCRVCRAIDAYRAARDKATRGAP